MRLIELFILFSLSARILFGRQLSYHKLSLLGWLPLIFCLLHLLFEGYRWQMVPLYLLAAAFAAVELLALRYGPANSLPDWRRWALTAAGLLLLALCSALPLVFPVPRLISPTGAYAIGTRTLTVTDSSRDEIYAPQPGQPRQLLLQIWYPAQSVAGQKPALWMNNIEVVGPAISSWLHLPPFFLDHVRYVRTHAGENAPLAEAQERYPVILFSHGYAGFRAQSTFLTEELASQGYIVVSIEHPYGALVSVMPDGEVIPLSPKALPDGLSDAEFELAAQKLVAQWSADQQFIMDLLAAWAEPGSGDGLSGRLDLEQLALIGHSTGGGAVIQTCANDARCKAGVTLDGWFVPVAPAVIEQGPRQPFLFLASESWGSDRNKALFETLFAGLPAGAAQARLTGTAHYDFTDLPALSPLAPAMKLKGPLKGERVQQIINSYTLTFLQAALQGRPASLPAATEVTLRYNKP